MMLKMMVMMTVGMVMVVTVVVVVVMLCVVPDAGSRVGLFTAIALAHALGTLLMGLLTSLC